MSRSMEEAATGLQLAFEESVNESFNLYQTATKGYVSFVRSYAALPKDVRDVFNFQVTDQTNSQFCSEAKKSVESEVKLSNVQFNLVKCSKT